MGQTWKLCPHCRRDIKTGMRGSNFKKHLEGCKGYHGIRNNNVSADKKLWEKQLNQIEKEVNAIKPLEEVQDHFRIT